VSPRAARGARHCPRRRARRRSEYAVTISRKKNAGRSARSTGASTAGKSREARGLDALATSYFTITPSAGTSIYFADGTEIRHRRGTARHPLPARREIRGIKERTLPGGESAKSVFSRPGDLLS
jgi:hypothetical protein